MGHTEQAAGGPQHTCRGRVPPATAGWDALIQIRSKYMRCKYKRLVWCHKCWVREVFAPRREVVSVSCRLQLRMRGQADPDSFLIREDQLVMMTAWALCQEAIYSHSTWEGDAASLFFGAFVFPSLCVLCLCIKIASIAVHDVCVVLHTKSHS